MLIICHLDTIFHKLKVGKPMKKHLANYYTYFKQNNLKTVSNTCIGY